MVSRSSRSKNCRSSNGALAKAGKLPSGSGGVYGEAGNNLVQNSVRGLAIGMGVEVQNDPMAQHRMRYLFDVVDAQMKAPLQQSRYSSALHERLRAARRTAEPDILLRGLMRF